MKRSKPQEPQGKKPSGKTAEISRRNFLNFLWAALGVGTLAESLWLCFSFLQPVRTTAAESKANSVVTAGSVAAFQPGTVTAFQRGEFYLVRLDDGGLLALSCKCTHLGCTVPWIEQEKKFLCPCHASAFDVRGSVVASPATRALDMFAVTIENNVIQVDTSRRIKRSGSEMNLVVYPPKI